jgi:hypothetical protein
MAPQELTFINFILTQQQPFQLQLQSALHAMGDPIRDKQALKIGIEATSSSSNTFKLYSDQSR